MARSQRETPHLRIVEEDPRPTIKRPTGSAQRPIDPFDDLEGAAYVVRPEIDGGQTKRQRLPRSPEQFAMVPLPWLSDRNWDALLPARSRLYLFLQWNTRRGTRPWTLSNAEARALGISANNKMRTLRSLETKGLITVTTTGKETAIVWVAPQALLPK